MKRIIFFLCIIFLVAGCASKRYTKKGAKFEEAGLYEDAANNYYEAAMRKSSNVDAKLGLRKTGQLTLDQKLSDFLNAYKQGNNNKATYEFINAEAYYNKVKSVGVNLSFPENYRTFYEEAKSNYLGKKYIEGLEKLDREEFADAMSIFNEIKSIDENYKDVKAQFITAKYEPRYREAVQFLENEYFRKAYYGFESIIAGAGDYKQSRILQEEAREKATITVLVTGFNASMRNSSDKAAIITTDIKGRISKSESPFIRLIDDSNIKESLYKEGEINLKVANLSGIDVILSGELLNFGKRNGKLEETPKRGYIKEIEKIRNQQGEEIEKAVYHKTNYSEFYAENAASLNVNYQMISTANSEVLLSRSFSEQKTDEVHYAVFEGDNNKLVPGYWKYKKGKSEEDEIKDIKRDVRELKRLLDGDRKMLSSDQLLKKLMTECVAEITSRVENYNPEE
jgi:hypothetical protein